MNEHRVFIFVASLIVGLSGGGIAIFNNKLELAGKHASYYIWTNKNNQKIDSPRPKHQTKLNWTIKMR